MPVASDIKTHYIDSAIQLHNIHSCVYESQFLPVGSPGFPPDVAPVTYCYHKIVELQTELWRLCILTKPHPYGEDLRYYLPFTEGRSLVTADHSGHNPEAIIHGASWDAGKFGRGYSLRFDGQDDYVQCRVTKPFTTSTITIAVWCLATEWIGPNRDARIISRATSSAVNDVHLMLSGVADGDATRLRGRLKTGGTTHEVIASDSQLQLDTWYFAAMTYDGSRLRLYQDNLLVADSEATGEVVVDNAIPMWVGANPDTSKFWKGNIDSVQIFSLALSPTYIAEMSKRQ